MSDKDKAYTNTKKTVHFNMLSESHSALRMACFKYNLSMQEVFEEISQRIGMESSDMISLLEDLRERKRNRHVKKLSKNDAQSLYGILEDISPIKEG
tara:strand:+ start:183 stop:473 length:291 start_codon:yes stop_codon:yes gene_type:complete